MRKLAFAAALALAGALALPVGSPADIVVFKRDGNRLQGRVENLPQAPDRIAFINGSGRLELRRETIDIIEEPDAVDWTHVGNDFLAASNYPAAVRHFQRALEADPNHQPAREGMDAAQEAISAQQDERVRAQQEEIAAKLTAISELTKPENYDERDYISAETELTTILSSEAASEEQKGTARRLLRDLYLAWGFARADRLDNITAEEKYLRVLEMDPDNATARDALLRIWRNDPAKKPQVLAAYQAKLEEDPNNLEYNKIVGELLYEANRYQEAITPLRKVMASGRFPGQGYDHMLRESFRRGYRAARDEGNYESSIRIFQQMLEVFPNEDQTDLAMLRYELEKERLAADDYEGKALLIRKLMDVGLIQTAEREAEVILRQDPENQVAIGILKELAQRDLTAGQEAFNRGEYLVARGMAERFIRDWGRFPEMAASANELYQRADVEAKKQAAQAREQAVQIAQRGEQYYFEAQRYVDLMNSEDVRSDSRPVSYKQEAIRLSERSIIHFEEALRIDPSLGPITGMDLNNRLRDARNLYNGLTARATRLPRSRNR